MKGIPQLMTSRWGRDKYLPQRTAGNDIQWKAEEHTIMWERMDTEIAARGGSSTRAPSFGGQRLILPLADAAGAAGAARL